MDKEKRKLYILILSTLLATTNLIPTSIKRKNNTKEIYTILSQNNNLNTKKEKDNIFNIIIEDFNINQEKEITNKFNYLYYKLNKKEDNNYSNYLKTLTSNYLSLPNLNDMIPQGITTYKNYIIISAYSENKQNLSKLYIFNNNNLVNIATLDNNSHVGGICYDNQNELLWITVKKQLYAYKIEDVINKDKITKKYETINLNSDIGNYSFLTYKSQRIYIGNYNYYSNSKILVYKLSPNKRNNNINFKLENILTIPSKIQGLDFITIDNQEYLILSKSYNLFDNSNILIYKYNNKNNTYTTNYISLIKCPPMLEEIKVKDNNLLTLYESCSSKYSDCMINMNHIYCSNIKRKIKRNK